MPINTKGFGFPINTNGQFPFLTKQQNDRMIKNNVLMNVLTIPGERVHRPSFGTEISTMVFRPVTSDIIIDIKTQIIQQVSQNDPRVIVKSVNVVESQKNTLLIDIIISPTQSPEETIEVRRLIRRQIQTTN